MRSRYLLFQFRQSKGCTLPSRMVPERTQISIQRVLETIYFGIKCS